MAAGFYARDYERAIPRKVQADEIEIVDGEGSVFTVSLGRDDELLISGKHGSVAIEPRAANLVKVRYRT